MSSLFSILWLILIASSFLSPLFEKRRIELARVKLLNTMSRKRGSRVISMIHRMEAISILGIPISRHIDIEDSEHILRAIRRTPKNVPIDIILHTPGGLVLAAEQIARALASHEAKVTVFVPHYAMSGGTLLALAADEIIMDEHAVLGPIDPQLGNYPAVSILKAIEQKDKNSLDDTTLILGDMAAKAMVQVYESVYNLLLEKFPEDKAQNIARTLTEGRWTHDYPITCRMLRDMGLAVCHEMPEEVYQLMELYPQPAQRRPSVQYVPVPFERRSPDAPSRGEE
ncbi:MAG TPA: ATP-dependent Clp protease proteolytic subunit [Bacillota bacterium]|jgi:ClpP class serine protease|nr:ATP-dependent Clp protease proteolytic subunit [Bacillota bacterium]HQE03560.1 ATP-dependent Clp protease proteolytic subunit [Bacillota bacterium]